ncbi:U6 snRNA phosphodiesterase Usb1, partial [Schizothecium vesticola]
LPPLPPAFHDLYASTVRTTPHDSPALHQGRTRTTPHVPGHWPSHLYLEWHPPAAAHAALTSLLSSLRAAAPAVEVHSFLTSDLGAPLPLHVSLSRPITLTTGEKEGFLREMVGAVGGVGGGPGWELVGDGVEWHRTEESGRSFLVMRVREARSAGGEGRANSNPNPGLTELLRRCNAVVEGHGQPGLYEWAFGEGEEAVGRAFHVSVAWSFAEPTEEVRRVTAEVFGEERARARVRAMRIGVDGVKVKIGNVVTHVPL